MNKLKLLKSALIGGASVLTLSNPAAAKIFNIPDGDLAAALGSYMQQSGVQIYFADDAVRGHRSQGAKGNYSETAALSQILRGTGFVAKAIAADAIGIVPQEPVRVAQAARRAPAAPAAAMPATVETVVVTAQKKSENIQNVPIAVTALSQAQLTERQIAGGPDLLRDVPNMNFSKTNFTGYSIELRGIGTQAISVTTDPAVAVAFNGTPFIRNHFFEQEFYDLADVEVLRGPQGTLYGRNATAGVVNLKSAQPTDQFEAAGSVDFGNFGGKRLEGMINLPIVGDKLDLRMAGEWTMRDGYSVNELENDKPIDGRDLWSGRASLRWRPEADLDVNLIWEHFQEHDDRMRSGKQLCKTAPIPEVDGVGSSVGGTSASGDFLSQGCLPSSLYSADAFEVPNGYSLAYYTALLSAVQGLRSFFDVYATTTQSRNLRAVDSAVNPVYRANNDTVELNVDYNITSWLTLTSQSGYNHDFLWSTQDYNRFNSAPGAFQYDPYAAFNNLITLDPLAGKNGVPADAGVFCDPQIGCSDRLALQDLSREHAWQASEELRLASHFNGPLNFSVGGNYLHYETVEDYFVFINTLTLFAVDHLFAQQTYIPGVTDDHQCLTIIGGYRQLNLVAPKDVRGCTYIDPNPIDSLNGNGHNYFHSQNPYVLNSDALFGEAYYNLTNDLKLTAGLRWTDDRKHFAEIPSELLQPDSYGFLTTGVVNQQWQRFTGRGVLDWTPQLSFTDQTLLYLSYAHGYKAGGANPPGAIFPGVSALNTTGVALNPIHPLTFKPEYIEAFELGTKNSLFDNSLTLNGDVFYYNYHGYQISRIVDRTAINDNFNAHVEGAELESIWEPLPGLHFNLAAGWEDTALAGGSKSVDLIDRTAGNPNWMVVKPFVTAASNCILPTYVVAELLTAGSVLSACGEAYGAGLDPATSLPYVPYPTTTRSGYAPPPIGNNPSDPYPGFDPFAGTPGDPYTGQNKDNYLGVDAGLVPNNGQGFDKNLSHHELPNAPPFTLSLGAQYTVPVSSDWAATLRGDFYWQGNSWARVFNDRPYDRLHGYSNLNLALILASADGWQVMGYVKNVFNTTAITGDFLNSDDTGLPTNVFLTDPRLYGVRVTKQFGEGDTGAMKDVEDFLSGLFADADNGRPPLWIELGGGLARLDAPEDTYGPSWLYSVTIPKQRDALDVQHSPALALEEEAAITFQPDASDWVVSASVRYGRQETKHQAHQQTPNALVPVHFTLPFPPPFNKYIGGYSFYPDYHGKFSDGQAASSEGHTIVDFQVGQDLGLGKDNGWTGTLSGGLRFAQFTSRSSVTLRAIPDLRYPSAPISSFAEKYAFKHDSVNFHAYTGIASSRRSFTGIGPSIAYKGSVPVVQMNDASGLDFGGGINFAVLFGRQKVQEHHRTMARSYHFQNFNQEGLAGGPADIKPGYFGYQSGSGVHGGITNSTSDTTVNRNRSVAVPNIGAFAAVSYRYQNAKITFGYRADLFFGAMDEGFLKKKSADRGFFGPYANISIGLGG